MANADLQFKLLLVGRGGMALGSLRINDTGFYWRQQIDGKAIDVKKQEISSVAVTVLAKESCQLGVRREDGATLTFLGLKEKDLQKVADKCNNDLGIEVERQQLRVSGHNWGDVALHGRSLAFGMDSKAMFEVPLPDVTNVQTQNKDEVLLEFSVDDTGRDREDTLIEMAFHVPQSHEHWAAAAQEAREAGNEKITTAAQALAEELRKFTEAGAGSDTPIVSFDKVSVLAPRGKFDIDMFSNHMRFSGTSQEYKIGYSSIGRLYILPKPGPGGQTLVAIGLDPPIRKGNTYYSFLLCQFANHVEGVWELNIAEELLEQKNVECGNKLHRSHEGPLHTVFAHVLRGLSAAKITRAKQETYRNSTGDGCAVRCSYRSDEGLLYPLEKCFLYVHKPPMVINHQDIDSIEFERQGGGVTTTNVRTFDLLIKQRGQGASYQFRNIQRGEWEPLYSFINARKIRIENLNAARQGPGGPGAGLDLGDDLDAGIRAARAEADDEEDEDEDFDISGDDMSESSGGSLDEEAGSDGGDADAVEMVDEEGINIAAVFGSKKSKKKPGTEADDANSKPSKPKKPRAPKAAAPAGGPADGEGDEEEGGQKPRKPRKKKDPNAPKKALSGFMFFSNASRDRIKLENPGVPFGQVGKLLGEEWKQLSAEGRAPFEAQAAKDKERYASAMAEYKAAGGAATEGADTADLE